MIDPGRILRVAPGAQLVWFDPGGVSGWAAVTVSAGWLAGGGSASWEGLRAALRTVSWGQIGNGTVGGEMLGEDELANIAGCDAVLQDWPDAAWGYEDFVVGSFNSGRDFLAPVRIFSALVYADLVRNGPGGRRPFRQSAANAKTAATNDRMKMAGLYKPGAGHATDALRHVALFLRRARASLELREEAWPELFA